MKKLLTLSFFAFVIFIFPTQAQQFSGTITNYSDDFIENAQIILQYPNGTPQNDTVYSDASGYYTIGEIQTTDISDLNPTNTKFTYILNAGNLKIKLSNSNENRVATLYSLQGKIVAQTTIQKIASSSYIANFNLNKFAKGLYIFSDGYIGIKIPFTGNSVNVIPPSTSGYRALSKYSGYESNSVASSSVTEPVEVTEANETSSTTAISPSTSSGYRNNSVAEPVEANEANDKYHLIITQPNYQTIDSTLQDIDPTQTYNYDFELEDWPSFFANLNFNVKGYENINLENANVEINGETIALSDVTDINGNVSFNNIPIRNYPDNKLKPDTLDITNLIGGLTWYDDQSDNQRITGSETGENYDFSYLLEASLNTYIQNLKTKNDDGEILGDVTWKLQNTDGTEVYANGVTNTTTGESEINYSKRYPGEMSGLELIASKDGYVNDTTTTSILPGQVDDLVVDLSQNPGEAYLWRIGQDELGQLGTTFDIVIKNSEFNYNDTIFNVEDQVAWKDTVPVNQSGITTYTVKYNPHTLEGKIPLYPKTISLDLTNGDTAQDYDTIYALEQEQKYVINVFDFENEGERKEANVEIKDNQNNVVFTGTTIDGIIETNYLPTGEDGTGFEGVVSVSPIDANYFGTRVVVTGGDMTVDDQQDLINNLGVHYNGYAYVMPEIQTDFTKTDTIAFYLIKQKREDPLNPGDSLQMDAYEVGEMESNSINTEYARYNEENVYFTEQKPTEYDEYRDHSREIFGFDFNENEVSTERNITINDYSIDNDNYKNDLGWNVSFGVNTTNPSSVNPSLFGKINISSLGDVSYDLTDWVGCAREDARKMSLNEVSSRESYMNSSTPSDFPDDLNLKDRVYTNLYLHFRPKQVLVNSSIRSITNLGYLFIVEKGTFGK